jgi:predicted AlkP superfamily phosphohydrolase/phosphomutase
MRRFALVEGWLPAEETGCAAHRDCAAAQPRPRLLVFGVDGGAWHLIEPLLVQGRLPAFAELLATGRRATLESVTPPLTAPAWQSIFTGCTPAEHGVFDMTVYDPALGRRRPPCYDDWRVPNLWDRVSEMGLTGGYLGIPFSYPPPEVDGWFVSGIMGTPSYSESMFRPRGLFGEVTAAAGEYPLDALEKRGGTYPIETLLRQIAWLHDAAMHLVRNHPTDVLVVVENYTDFVQHFFLRSREYQVDGQATDVIALAYEAADRLLGDIRTEIGAEVPCVVVSDHGFAPLEGYINATWLAAALSPSGEGAERARETSFRALKGLWRATGKAALQALRVDPARVSQWGVRALRRSGDEPEAVVVGHYGSVWLTGDPEATSDERIRRGAEVLAGMRDPDGGGPLLSVRLGREVYAGPYERWAPHLVVAPVRPHHELRRAAPSAPLVIGHDEAARVGMDRNTTEGTHAPDGICAISGAGSHVALPGTLPEVLPTLLALLDGSAQRGAAPLRPPAEVQRTSAYTPEEEQTILSRLQDLGYID